jgi:hypothetical protein
MSNGRYLRRARKFGSQWVSVRLMRTFPALVIPNVHCRYHRCQSFDLARHKSHTYSPYNGPRVFQVMLRDLPLSSASGVAVTVTKHTRSTATHRASMVSGHSIGADAAPSPLYIGSGYLPHDEVLFFCKSRSSSAQCGHSKLETTFRLYRILWQWLRQKLKLSL